MSGEWRAKNGSLADEHASLVPSDVRASNRAGEAREPHRLALADPAAERPNARPLHSSDTPATTEADAYVRSTVDLLGALQLSIAKAARKEAGR